MKTTGDPLAGSVRNAKKGIQPCKTTLQVKNMQTMTLISLAVKFANFVAACKSNRM